MACGSPDQRYLLPSYKRSTLANGIAYLLIYHLLPFPWWTGLRKVRKKALITDQ